MLYTSELKEEYIRLYKSCQIHTEQLGEIDIICENILNHKDRYVTVSEPLHIPWYVLGVIHNMEAGLRFDKHLHNGDSLERRTVNVPEGRPQVGHPPPFSWEESATDALKYAKLNQIDKWDLPRILFELEGYNGWGYRTNHPHVLTPYLWSFSNHYQQGKYIADGRWSESEKSQQCGVGVIIRRLEQRGEIQVSEELTEPIFVYSDKKIPHGLDLQIFLNRFNGINLHVDGWPGRKTSAAVKKLFGFYLKGDPRV